MAKLYKDRNGVTFYPTCSWEKNQHKIYNAYDRVWIRRDEERERGEFVEETEKELEMLEYLLEVFNSHVVNGIVYAPYQSSVLIKEYITAYDLRGDFKGMRKN